MPESRDWGHENLMLAFRVLLVSGLLLFGAVVAYISGRDGLRPSQHHIDATLVLGGCGVVTLVAATMLSIEARNRSTAARPRR